MKRKPPRCASCGGPKRESDDKTDAERKSPLCWVCRMAAQPRQNGK